MGDGDPKLLEDMIHLDCSMNANSKLICNHPSCSKELPPGKEPILDIPSSSTDNQSHNPANQDGNSETAVDKLELGWSKLGPNENGSRNKK